MSKHQSNQLDPAVCNKARLARDARFDGLFFTGVKTTGVFCRPICPARPPQEKNVAYYTTALGAAKAGLRPCLRCRPESAPGSSAWRGTQTTLIRAVSLIDNGEWREQSLPEFAERLGVSDRYLRRLFQQNLGVSPLKYANFQRALFAKQLLQQTKLPVSEVAYIAGFGSTRRFNTAFSALIGLNPGQVRSAHKVPHLSDTGIRVFLSYRPPYNWSMVRDFYRARQIAGLEVVTQTSYARSFSHRGSTGIFTAHHDADKNGFTVDISLSKPEHTLAVVQRIRRLLDVDADTNAVSRHLTKHPLLCTLDSRGIRLPGMWSPFEAGVRAILGQQVSVKAAHNMVTRLVAELGEPLAGTRANDDVEPSNTETNPQKHVAKPMLLFPEPAAVARSDLAFLAMPNKRRQALRLLARHLLRGGKNQQHQGRELNDDMSNAVHRRYDDWLQIAGIGPWTVEYTAFRMGHPDIFLAGDLGVKNALKKLASGSEQGIVVDRNEFSPWGSYATLLLWQSLAAPTDEAKATNVKKLRK